MNVKQLSEDLGLELKECQAHLAAEGMSMVNSIITVPTEIEALVRRKISQNKLTTGDDDEGEIASELITKLPSGKRVVILFSNKKGYRLALHEGINVPFSNNQLILDVYDNEEDWNLFDTIMTVGSADVFVVSSVPNPKGRKRELFDKQIDDWIIEKGFGASGQVSLRGTTRLQALFHSEEQAALAEEYDEVTPRTLKSVAIETKSLIQAKY